jgi:hypothetical protein
VFTIQSSVVAASLKSFALQKRLNKQMHFRAFERTRRMGNRPAMMRNPPRKLSPKNALPSSLFVDGIFAGESCRVDRGEIRRLRFALRGTGCASSTFVRIGDEVVTAHPTFERPNVSSTRMQEHLGMVLSAKTCAVVDARGRRLMPGEEQRVNKSECMKRMSQDRTVGVHV